MADTHRSDPNTDPSDSGDLHSDPQVQALVSFLEHEAQPMIVLDPDYNILAANTGIYPEVTIEDMTEDDWDKVQGINLKGIFFRDDDLEQMTFSGTGRRGGNRYHDPPHLSFSRSRRLRLGTSLSASDFAIHKDSVIDFYMLPCYNNIILAGPWDMGPWGHQERSLRS